ncbi:hypothetical protein LSM04_004268 [Trypanosoma melophagium]|uniref:uncharacterized protein n=1 Tax=Trypanosoma melophagium TaxID=715481 RepID=UPI00351A0F9A|nr:hypothetical protein LSM04_004268 [Trypanosoma melophagium]
MTSCTEAVNKLDAVVNAMRAAVMEMESRGAANTNDVIKGAAEFQCTLHILSREAAANSVKEEQTRRGG